VGTLLRRLRRDDVKVLTIVAHFWPVVGGAENQARRLAAELRRQGVDVEVWTGRWSRAWPRSDTIDGLPVRRLGPGWPLRPLRLRRYAFAASLFRELLARAAEFDVVHVHQVLYPALAAALAARLRGKPVIARISSSGSTSDLAVFGRRGLGVGRALMRRLLTRVVAVSAAAEAECARAGYARARVVRIPNGVRAPDDVPERTEAPELRVLFVGGLRPEKRVEVLLEAWHRAGRPGLLELAGDGSERQALERAASPLAPSVRFLGAVAEPAPLYARACVFVLPSDAEGMSNALLEAMAAGCACIATWIGGNPDVLAPEATGPPPAGEYLRGSAGWLTRVGDAAGLAAALQALARDRGMRVALGTAARRRCQEHFALDKVAARYRELYAELAPPSTLS
jgi:glycosyltransferase involved in cell wall biosynthesis